LEIRGNNGEKRPNIPLTLDLKHAWFKEQVHVTVQSDRSGRIQLGKLLANRITNVTASTASNASWTFSLSNDERHYPRSLHYRVGQTIEIAAPKNPQLESTTLQQDGPPASSQEPEDVFLVSSREGYVAQSGFFPPLSSSSKRVHSLSSFVGLFWKTYRTTLKDVTTILQSPIFRPVIISSGSIRSPESEAVYHYSSTFASPAPKRQSEANGETSPSARKES
jgi:hypothetical protein